jgi:hypothetical protein
MKRILLFAFSFFLAIGISVNTSAQKADFNGTWKLDMTRSTLTEYTPVLRRIDVKIVGDSLLTKRYYDTGDGQEYPFTENLTLDGKEYNITIYDMPRKTKASWSDQDRSVLVESTTTFDGDSGPEDFKSAETWKADKANKTLAINFKNNVSGNEAAGALIFRKSE